MLTVQVRLSAETDVQPVQLASSEPAGTSATSVTVLALGADPTQTPVFAAQAMSGSVPVEVKYKEGDKVEKEDLLVLLT